MPKFTLSQLRATLTRDRRCRVVTFLANTSAKANKGAKFCPQCKGQVRTRKKADTCPACHFDGPLTSRANPFPDARKVSHVNGMVNWKYENAVNNQRAREQGQDADPFEAQPRTWGERVPGTPLVQHRGKEYVEVKVQRVLATRYETPEGDGIDVDLLRPFLPVEKTESRRQGVGREIVLRDYGLESIRSLTTDGQPFEVQAPDAA